MKAAVLYKDLDIKVEDVDTPLIQEDEVLIRVRATGICGSDVPRVLKGGARYYPIILGHEFSGEIEKVGNLVTGFEVGDKVTAAPLIPCHECEDCRKGNYSQCKNYRFIGSRISGTWAEYVAVPRKNLVKLDKNVSYVQGAFVEPITVCLHALEIMKFTPARSVAVIGMGTIGLLTIQCVKNMGAGSISVFDIDDEKLEKAKALGADHTFNTLSKELMSQVNEVTNNRGYEIVIDCAGAEPTIKLSLKIAGNKGKVMFIGTPTSNTTLSQDEFEQINRKELIVQGSWMSYSSPYPGFEWKLAANYLAEDKIDVEPLIAKTININEIQKAFEEINETRAMPGKIIMEV